MTTSPDRLKTPVADTTKGCPQAPFVFSLMSLLYPNLLLCGQSGSEEFTEQVHADVLPVFRRDTSAGKLHRFRVVVEDFRDHVPGFRYRTSDELFLNLRQTQYRRSHGAECGAHIRDDAVFLLQDPRKRDSRDRQRPSASDLLVHVSGMSSAVISSLSSMARSFFPL